MKKILIFLIELLEHLLDNARRKIKDTWGIDPFPRKVPPVLCR